jgi:hypothetical protein
MGNFMRELSDIFLHGRQVAVLLESSQASPSRPFGKNAVKVKMLGWAEVVA